eukprot:1761160-Prymnesium_polylepis.1
MEAAPASTTFKPHELERSGSARDMVPRRRMRRGRKRSLVRTFLFGHVAYGAPCGSSGRYARPAVPLDTYLHSGVLTLARNRVSALVARSVTRWLNKFGLFLRFRPGGSSTTPSRTQRCDDGGGAGDGAR